MQQSVFMLELPVATCSCHTTHHHKRPELSFTRELVCVRGTYRYADLDALDAALADLRAYLDDDGAQPLRLWCWVSENATLEIDITVPMFSDHVTALSACDRLARTASDSTHKVCSRPL